MNRTWDTEYEDDPDFEALGCVAFHLYRHLCTGKLLNRAGICRATVRNIAHTSRFAEPDVRAALAELVQARKIAWDEATNRLWVYGFSRRQFRTASMVLGAVKDLKASAPDLASEWYRRNASLATIAPNRMESCAWAAFCTAVQAACNDGATTVEPRLNQGLTKVEPGSNGGVTASDLISDLISDSEEEGGAGGNPPDPWDPEPCLDLERATMNAIHAESLGDPVVVAARQVYERLRERLGTGAPPWTSWRERTTAAVLFVYRESLKADSTLHGRDPVAALCEAVAWWVHKGHNWGERGKPIATAAALFGGPGRTPERVGAVLAELAGAAGGGAHVQRRQVEVSAEPSCATAEQFSVSRAASEHASVTVAVQELIRARVSVHDFNSWFLAPFVASIDGDVVAIAVPDAFHAQWSQKNHQEAWTLAVRHVTGRAARVCFAPLGPDGTVLGALAAREAA